MLTDSEATEDSLDEACNLIIEKIKEYLSKTTKTLQREENLAEIEPSTTPKRKINDVENSEESAPKRSNFSPISQQQSPPYGYGFVPPQYQVPYGLVNQNVNFAQHTSFSMAPTSSYQPQFMNKTFKPIAQSPTTLQQQKTPSPNFVEQTEIVREKPQTSATSSVSSVIPYTPKVLILPPGCTYTFNKNLNTQVLVINNMEAEVELLSQMNL